MIYTLLNNLFAKMTKYHLTLIICVIFTGFSRVSAQNNNQTLWYDKPAAVWPEALPIGNSYMGAMIFGDAQREHIQFNESTLYSGEPDATFKNINVRKYYQQVTELLKAGKYQEADAIVGKELLGRNYQAYQPLGDFFTNFEHKQSISNYKRWLDIGTATAYTEYTVGNTKFKRQYFASYPDHIIVVKFTAEGSDKINCTLRFTTPHVSTAQYGASANTLKMNGKAPYFVQRRELEQVESIGDQHKYPELYEKDGTRRADAKNILYDTTKEGRGTSFESQAKILNVGGKLTQTGDSIKVENANEIVIILTAATSYNGFDKSPSKEGKNPNVLVNNYLKAVEKKTFAQLYSTHLTDYKKLFDRVDFKLLDETEQSKLPTDQRVSLFNNGKDPSFPSLYFQFGRYLMISGSRPNGQPLNLQGIWNDQILPPWNGGYTTNINAEMNYWIAEATNLSECHEPFFKAIKELSVNGKNTARFMYGNEGWASHHNMDIWRNAEPVDRCLCSFWPMGAGWLTSHFWERYLYTGDKTFLQNEVYPLLKGVVEFYQGWLVKDAKTGYLITPIGHSPESYFLYDDKKRATISQAPTMDMAIVREALSRYIEMCKTLGIEDELSKNIKQQLPQLLPYQVGKYGQLQEWKEDFEDADPKHRHFSHLYAIHPGNQINNFTTPELAAASKRVMERRGDLATGWSMGWKVNVWARLLDGDHALKLLNNLFKIVRTQETNTTGGGTYPNLFCAHPPFQIDGNFGATAGIAQMLVQSHAGELHLLPALPSTWQSGKVKGLKARGGFTVDMEWEKGKLTKATIHSALGGNCRIRTSEKITVDVPTSKIEGANPNTFYNFVDAGKPLVKENVQLLEMSVNQGNVIDFKTEKGKMYNIIPQK
jgi:alpha-L-fucosidase 2